MKRKYYFFITLFLLLVISYLVSPKFPLFITQYYNQKIYSGLDSILYLLSNVFPFSIGDIVYALIVCYVVYKSFVLLKKKMLKEVTLFLIGFLVLFFSFFQFFWGLNNYKLSVAHQLELGKGYSKTELDSITNQLINVVNSQHLLVTNDTLQKVDFEKNLELFNNIAQLNYKNLPDHLKGILIDNKINNVKPSFYSYVQSYTGFSGYFNPLTHENQVNIEIPTIGMPVTVAHEMAHQLGIASEAEANFFGYITTVQSSDEKFKYAANLYALKYCLKEYRRENEETYQLLYNQLNSGVQQNILDSELFWQSKRNVSSYLFKNLYGGFLKINNQKDGIRSYNKFVDLLINYNKKYREI